MVMSFDLTAVYGFILTKSLQINKRQRKPKGRSIMDHLEKTKRAINNIPSREKRRGDQEWTIQRKQKGRSRMDHLEKADGTIKNGPSRENTRGDKEYTIQRKQKGRSIMDHQEKKKGRSRKDHLEIQTILGTQNMDKNNPTQSRKLNNGVNPGVGERGTVSASS